MFIESQSADPAVHALSIRIAKRCVWIIQAVLREEARGLKAGLEKALFGGKRPEVKQESKTSEKTKEKGGIER
jgi:hypothetical protein